METTATLSISAQEKTDLVRILGCSTKELPEVLSKFASAALTEYATMILGQKVFSRGSDMLEYRLFLLIDGAFGKRIPDDKEVSRLFQTTATESRALIRSVMSKYQYQLTGAITDTLGALISRAEKDEDTKLFTVTVNSANLVDELNRLLAEVDGTLPPVAKKRGSVATYEIAPSSHARLVSRLEA